MSNPNPSHKTRFKKGISGNPNGCPPMPKEVKEARKLNRIEVERLLNKFLQWPSEDVIKFANDQSNPALEVLIARVLSVAMKNGDDKRLNFLLDRLVGKVKENVAIEGDLNVNMNVHKHIVDMIEDIKHRNKEEKDAQKR
jgi:hypothetical protein